MIMNLAKKANVGRCITLSHEGSPVSDIYLYYVVQREE